MSDQRRVWTRKQRIGAVVLTPVVLAAVLVMALHRPPTGEGNALLEGPFFPVAQGALTINVTESGTINPTDQEIISNEIEGRTTILYLIPEGTRVQKGDLLVELDASQLADAKVDQEIKLSSAEAAFIQSRENLEVVKNQAQSDIDKAELALQFAKEDVVQYEEGEFPNSLKEYEARITLAKEELQRAHERLKWSDVLFKEKYLAESELQADQLSVKKADLDVELAQNSLALLKDFTYKRRMTELRSDAKQAEMALERARLKASADVVQAEAQLNARDSEFRQQGDKLAKLVDQITKARIVAPREGLVVYATSARFSWRGNTEPLDEGQEVRERQELIYLPTASTFKAEVKVHESNLDKIRVGLPVRVTVDALPGRTFTGRVASIAPLPDAGSMFMNPDLKLYNTEVVIEGGGDVLRTGMSCKTDIIAEYHDSALYIPVQAVTRVAGKATVYVREGEQVLPRPVEIGLDNNRMVHVLSGLAADEEVLLTPPLGQDGGAGRSVADTPLADDLRPTPATQSPTPAEAPASAAAVGPDHAQSRKSLTPEERQKLRKRFANMSEEERAALRQRHSGARPARNAP